MKNKIINNYVLPRIILTGTVVAFIPPLSYYVVESKNEAEEIKNVETKDKLLDPIFLSFTVLAATMLVWYILGTKKYADKLATENARNYIAKATKKYPELSDFQSLISNDYAMKYVAATIANNLNPNEQKQIRDIILRTDLVFEPLGKEDAYTQIEQIIGNHIQRHPEFLLELQTAMACAEQKYITGAKQQNNQQR